MKIQLLTTDNYKKMPWKNGQGSTLEIARNHGEGLDDFDWRVSIADVNSAGSFSFFPNKKRIIGVLDGTGLILHIDKQNPQTLNQKEFLAFHGENKVFAELLNEPIRDFNLIYNPDKYAARLQWQNISSVAPWVSDANYILVFNTMENLKLDINNTSYELKYFDTILIQNDNQSIQIIPELNTENYNFGIIELFLK
ncbi:HutD family protein [Providencia sneebia]|uniref:HutD family protein n=1 Tax=Providencia sneebia DSM 19967 TaxID=1141660 RepID=K8WEW5_9GAMM|nr:HutD family protein [Providencia sneebia]EKT56002.1 hypothetical protein OO7_13574 [Providencia sneebia DSM 19967]